MTHQLDSLRNFTHVVADTGDIDAIRQHQPEDATTNPSLILKAAQLPQYQPLIAKSIDLATGSDRTELIDDACDRLAVAIGCEILTLIPGLISTEVDARLSFDQQATYNKAKKLIALYEANGVSRDRVLIKIASTWEGIQAAARLEAEGIRCNLTLLFHFVQAAACAAAKATLISPFVGRILDWYKQQNPDQDYSGARDPGVQSVTEIYQYYKTHNIDTIVMGASFRNIREIEQLTGCDKLTISPALLAELSQSSQPLTRHLDPSNKSDHSKLWQPSEAEFRWHMNSSEMATTKLSEGIRNFAADQNKLVRLMEEHCAELA